MEHLPRARRALLNLAIASLLGSVWVPDVVCAAAAATPTLEIPVVSRVRVEVRDEAARQRFFTLGLDLIGERHGSWAEILAWPGDLEALARAGFAASVLDADAGRAAAVAAGATKPVTAPRTSAVPPFGSGSLAGFYTYAEINDYLAEIAANDVNGIVSPVVSIGTSRQGRSIPAVRIAKESSPDHSRPRVLLTGLTHAREPEGMQICIYFINKLIAGYGVDPNITYLVDNREIWFVPCVNPDGYVINQTTWQNTGSFGLWRKNARDNNGDTVIGSGDGVDLNRNYGFQWAFDNSGSSGSPSSETYRGPSGFSEPETQAIRDFSILHAFRTSNNYHTYFEGTLYPWAYNGSNSPDSNFFVRMADDMLRDAQYAYGIPVDLLYPVNGDSNDWLYGDTVLKPRAMAVTTEAGDQNDGFWPAQARIIPLAHKSYRSNAVLAYAAGTYIRGDGAAIISNDGWLHPNGTEEVEITLRSLGLDASTGDVTVNASTSAAGITIVDAVSTYAPLAAGTTAVPQAGDRITVHADASVPAGTIVPIVLDISDQGGYSLRDTTSITVGQPLVVFQDNGSGGLANWTVTNGPVHSWGIQNVLGNPLFSDSPTGTYDDNTATRLTLTAPLVLTGGAKAYLTFNTQWDFEGGYDFGRVEISTNNGASWTAVAGRNTRPGHGTSGNYGGGTQTLGQPGYDMTQRFMIPETIDLSAYAGLANVRLRFRVTADVGTVRDGWLIDDIKVLVYPNDATDAGPVAGSGPTVEFAAASANPFVESTSFLAAFRAPTVFRAAVYGVNGRLVRVLAQGIAKGSREITWDGRDNAGTRVAAGAYLVRLETAHETLTRRVVHLH